MGRITALEFVMMDQSRYNLYRVSKEKVPLPLLMGSRVDISGADPSRLFARHTGPGAAHANERSRARRPPDTIPIRYAQPNGGDLRDDCAAFNPNPLTNPPHA